jgi:ABC-type branched-subunit amino acid transport system substrate-binding protein
MARGFPRNAGLTPLQRWVRAWQIIFLAVFLVALLVGGALVARKVFFPASSTPTPGPQIKTTPAGGCSASGCIANGIGISDGHYAFDTDRPDGITKKSAAAALLTGKTQDAESLWDQATATDTNDAEALIYKEDQRVLDSGHHYITLIVATMLTGSASYVNAGRENLQGAYVAQKMFNDGFQLGNDLLVRLLVANSGGTAGDAQTVARQIVQVAASNPTFVGVMGWPFSGQTLQALDILKRAKIPMVSPTASSDALTNVSPFFFHVCPSNLLQAVAGARYASQRLQAKRVVLFVDPANSYSQSLADDFRSQFALSGGQIIATEQYTVGSPAGLFSLSQQASSLSPDLIYFSGYADDMGVLMTDLQNANPNLLLMGGDALYELGAYPSSARASYHRLRFTAFAFPDEWNVLGLTNPAFFQTYANSYDPSGLHPRAYEYSRPDADVMLSYDATLALLQASANRLAQHPGALTPAGLEQGLLALHGAQAIQGVSGQIALGSDSNPVNKAVVVLSVNPGGYTQLAAGDVQGCFIKDNC